MVAGSTGESPTLTHTEKIELFRAVGEAVRGTGKMIAGVGTYSTAETLELAEAAAGVGADGLLVVTPYYNKPPQRGLTAHFTAVADATDAAGDAVQHPGPHGAADRGRHAARAREPPQHRRGEGLDRRLPVGVEPDGATRPTGSRSTPATTGRRSGTLCLGAVGVVSVASHLVGTQIHQMLDLIASGDVPAARKIHEELTPLFNALFITSNPIPVKAALEMLGRSAGPTRLPLVTATAQESARVRAALEDAGLLA